MKKVIGIEDNFEDGQYKRPSLTVVRDPEKMPIVVIHEKAAKPAEKGKKPVMPEMPAGSIKSKKNDCL